MQTYVGSFGSRRLTRSDALSTVNEGRASKRGRRMANPSDVTSATILESKKGRKEGRGRIRKRIAVDTNAERKADIPSSKSTFLVASSLRGKFLTSCVLTLVERLEMQTRKGEGGIED